MKPYILPVTGRRGSPKNPNANVARAAFSAWARSFAITCAGVIPAHGAGDTPASPRHRAAMPATCGEAMLVPELSAYPARIHVERMHEPGAAIR